MKLRIRIINFIHKTASGSRKFRTLLTPVGALVFTLFTAGFAVLSLYTDKMLSFPAVLPQEFLNIAAVPVILTGIFFMSWSVFHFLRVKGTPVPLNPPPELVSSGPYAHSRNPMLTGVFILLFGLGIYFNSISMIFVYTPLFILLMVLELKLIEEPELELRLGKKYLDFKHNTPMFFPRISWKSKSE